MSFDEGMRLFRSGDVPGACEQFHQAVEQDENNHKAWNALGICLSKTGEHEDADTCFENALMLDPGNSTYERNRERNSLKIPIRRPEKKPVEPVRTNTRKEYDSGYQRNWFQIPLYFIPMILAIANPVIGLLAVIACAYYIKRDAESLNAGMNPDASMWGKMKGWEWMLLLVLFWILLPLYSWKREQIYEENYGYGPDHYSGPPHSAEEFMWRYVKVGGAAVIVIFSLAFIGMAFNHDEQSSFKSGYDDGLKQSVEKPTSDEKAVLVAPVVTQTQKSIITVTPTITNKRIKGDYEFIDSTAKLFTLLSSNSIKSSSALEKRDYNTVEELTNSNIRAIDDYNLNWDSYVLTQKAQELAKDINPVLIKYRSALVNISKAIIAHNSGDYSLEEMYFGDALPDMIEAITQMRAISKKLS